MTQLSFNYRALNTSGKKVRGVVHAEDEREAYRQIVASGLQPLKVNADRSEARGVVGRSVSSRDLAHLTFQFAVFMQARIPIADGLRSIAEQERNSRLRHVIEDVAAQIESGSSVSASLAPYRDLFGDVYVETIRAAEKSGNMIKVLNHLAEMLDSSYETTKRVKGALMYPACVVVALALAVTFLTIFVVPRFATMFASRGLALPLPTQIIVSFSDFVRSSWPILLGGLFLGVLGVRWAWRHPVLRQRLDTWLHRIPGIGQILRHVAISRFAHIFGLTLQSGLSVLDALDMAGRASGRPLMQADAQKMKQQVNRGGSISDVVFTCTYLPAFARRMIVAGVEAAELPRMCEIIARHYDRELEYLTRNIATVIEPILIVGLAGIVLLVALAFFLPMWDMGVLIS